ncbi:hypothetical protein L596_012841 [Steinernema carpocapsae]|uniref:Uncharacterized protein n=1 Tax=Steinernema carpocapsae TaxID=34508 RepID=A0A4U5NYM0_STECR|nr:hypothetical protein L596_012841 [Steinernema carpocapsae]
MVNENNLKSAPAVHHSVKNKDFENQTKSSRFKNASPKRKHVRRGGFGHFLWVFSGDPRPEREAECAMRLYTAKELLKPFCQIEQEGVVSADEALLGDFGMVRFRLSSLTEHYKLQLKYEKNWLRFRLLKTDVAVLIQAKGHPPERVHRKRLPQLQPDSPLLSRNVPRDALREARMVLSKLPKPILIPNSRKRRHQMPFLDTVQLCDRCNHFQLDHVFADDLESWFYMACDPWTKEADKDKAPRAKEDFMTAEKSFKEALKWCPNLPPEFIDVLYYVNSVSGEFVVPQTGFVHKVIEKVQKRLKLQEEAPFPWCKDVVT